MSRELAYIFAKLLRFAVVLVSLTSIGFFPAPVVDRERLAVFPFLPLPAGFDLAAS